MHRPFISTRNDADLRSKVRPSFRNPGEKESDFDTFSQASRTITPFASIYSAGGELQAGDDNAEDAVCEMEGIVLHDELLVALLPSI